MKKCRKLGLLILLMLSFSLPVLAANPAKQKLVVDQADLLTKEEEDRLLKELEDVSSKQKCDVVVLTVPALEGKSAMEFADDYFDENGYGYGEEQDGILLLLSMEERDWWISTHGFGIEAFTDAGLDYMTEKFLPELGDGEYADAFFEYAELCNDFLKEAREGKPYDGKHMPKPKVTIWWILLDALIGFVLVYLMATVKKSKLKSVHENPVARDYEIPGSFVLTRNRDVLVNKYITSRTIETSSSGSSSGSSTHTSSSGRSHGGCGGKF